MLVIPQVIMAAQWRLPAGQVRRVGRGQSMKPSLSDLWKNYNITFAHRLTFAWENMGHSSSFSWFPRWRMLLHGCPKHKSLVIVLHSAGGFDPEEDGTIRDARVKLECLGEGEGLRERWLRSSNFSWPCWLDILIKVKTLLDSAICDSITSSSYT